MDGVFVVGMPWRAQGCREAARHVCSSVASRCEALATCFAVDATVVDEGCTFEGLAAITAWKIEVKRKCADTVEPLEGVSRHGKTVVTARVSSDSPGSPVTLAFIFRLEQVERLGRRLPPRRVAALYRATAARCTLPASFSNGFPDPPPSLNMPSRNTGGELAHAPAARRWDRPVPFGAELTAGSLAPLTAQILPAATTETLPAAASLHRFRADRR
jgi:hypothetical protein